VNKTAMDAETCYPSHNVKSHFSNSIMATDHHKDCHLTMELGTNWFFLVAILKEDLWRKEMLSL
jgi:hypothetical protein